MPSENNLGCCDSVFCCDSQKSWVLEDLMASDRGSRGDASLLAPRSIGRSQGTISLKNNSIDLAEVPEILLLEVRVALVLEDCWLVLGPRDVEDLLDLPLVEVGEANGLDQPLVHQFSHLKPSLNVVRTMVSAVIALVVKGE